MRRDCRPAEEAGSLRSVGNIGNEELKPVFPSEPVVPIPRSKR